MLRGYRSIVAALVGIGLIAAGIGYGLAEQSGYADRAYDQSANYAKNTADQITKTCFRLTRSEQPKCFHEGAERYRLDTSDKQREYEDLIAQRKAALWSMIMGVAALIGMALSVVGVILVWLSFAEQRTANQLARDDAVAAANEGKEAMKIAQQNARAVVRTADIAEKSMIISQRAYVAVDTIESMPCGEAGKPMAGWAITPRIKNAGRTRADNVQLLWRYNILKKTEAGNFTFQPPENEITPLPIAVLPGGGGGGAPQGVTFEELEAVQRGETAIIVWGTITYNDLFEPEVLRLTEFACNVVVIRPVRNLDTVPINFQGWHAHNNST